MPTQAAPVWRPSAARTIVLDAFLPPPRGGAALAPPPPAWPAKDPADVLDYQFDIAPALIGNDGDAIATVDVAVTPSGPGHLALTGTRADGASAVLWFAAGIAGTVYAVQLSITTRAGRTLARGARLPVLALSVPAVAGNTLQDETGGELTDETGAPITTVP